MKKLNKKNKISEELGFLYMLLSLILIFMFLTLVLMVGINAPLYKYYGTKSSGEYPIYTNDISLFIFLSLFLILIAWRISKDEKTKK